MPFCKLACCRKIFDFLLKLNYSFVAFQIIFKVKNIMQKFVLSAIFILSALIIFNQHASAQDLTWNELKQMQILEKTQLENLQKETLRSLIEVQKVELERLKAEGSSTANDILILIDKHKEERLQMIRTYSEERTKLAQMHVEERKAFMQNRNPK
jgi:hypothetical protein